MNGIDYRWLLTAGALDEYVARQQCLDKSVAAVDCEPRRQPMLLHNGLPYPVKVTPPQFEVVTLIVDAAIYRAPWGLLHYAHIVGFPRTFDRLQTRLSAASITCSDIPYGFLKHELLPHRIDKFENILRHIAACATSR